MAKSALTRSFLKRYIPLIVLNAIIILAIVTISQYVLVKYYDKDKMQLASNEFREMQALYGEQALAMAKTLANDPEIVQAFQMPSSDQQRALLAGQSQGIFQSLKEKYQQPIIVYIKPDEVIFRAPKPKLFGDKPIARPHLKHVLQSGQGSASLELIKAGFAMNGVAPVIASTPQGDSVLGVAQVSLPFNELYGKIRENIPGSQIAILMNNARTSAVKDQIKGQQVGNFIIGHSSTPSLEKYLEQNPQIMQEGYKGYARLGDETYRLMVQKIPGFQGDSVGLMVFAYNVSDVIRYALMAVGISLLFVIFSFLVVGWILERFVERRIIDPVADLSKQVMDISMGKHLEKSIQQTENNEIGTIQSSTERLRKTLLNMLKHVQKQQS